VSLHIGAGLSMGRREQLIEAMGLGPVWKLRQSASDQASSTEVEQGAAPATATGAPSREATPARAPVRSAPPRAVAAPVATAAADPEREQRILQMDWTQLREAVSTCRACSLCSTRRQAVFGVGDEQAEWMLVGEAPGAEEDARGEPFVGQAGQLLDNMLAALDMERGKNVYVANVLKCRPPGNRNPEPAEVARCSPHLVRQLALVQPRLILAMGRFAAQALLETDASIASLRGKVHRYQGVPVIVTYHPAYLLRNLPDKAKSWQDLLFARRTLAELKANG
jgi:DNA polymerase